MKPLDWTSVVYRKFLALSSALGDTCTGLLEQDAGAANLMTISD